MNKGRLLPLVIVFSALLAPSVGGAHDGHCVDIFFLSGFTAAGDENRQGTNPGAVSCQLDQEAWNASPAHVDTNYTIPGSTHLWVALFNTFAEPQRGTITVGDGQPEALTFAMNEARGRWESQSISLEGVPMNTPLVATVDVDGVDQTLTYMRI